MPHLVDTESLAIAATSVLLGVALIVFVVWRVVRYIRSNRGTT